MNTCTLEFKFNTKPFKLENKGFVFLKVNSQKTSQSKCFRCDPACNLN